MPLTNGWVVVNTVGHVKRAVVLAVISSVSGLAYIAGAFSFVSTDAPRYITGYMVCEIALGAGFLLSVVYAISLRWENKARDSGRREYLRAISETEELADRHVLTPWIFQTEPIAGF